MLKISTSNYNSNHLRRTSKYHPTRIDWMCLSLSERKTEQLPCEQSLQGFGFSHTFLPPVSHGDKSGLFQNPVKVAHKAVVLIFSFTLEYFTLKKNCLLSPRHTLYLIHGLLPGQNQLSQQNVTKVYKNSKK